MLILLKVRVVVPVPPVRTKSESESIHQLNHWPLSFTLRGLLPVKIKFKFEGNHLRSTLQGFNVTFSPNSLTFVIFKGRKSISVVTPSLREAVLRLDERWQHYVSREARLALLFQLPDGQQSCPTLIQILTNYCIRLQPFFFLSHDTLKSSGRTECNRCE